MNPVLQAAAASVLRWLLAIAAGYLVRAGIWTGVDAEAYIATAALAILALWWSLWEKYKSRVTLLTALMMPAGTTENGVKAVVASGVVTPSVHTPPDTVPGVPK